MEIKSLYEAEILEFKEYSLRMKAFELQEVDQRFYMHLQAWLNNQVKATKEQGKKQVSVFKEFKDFFDYEKEMEKVNGKRKANLTDEQRKKARYVAYINSLK